MRKKCLALALILSPLVSLYSLPGLDSSMRPLPDANIYQEDFLQLARYVRLYHPGFGEQPLQAMTGDEYAALVEKVYRELGPVSSASEAKVLISWFLEKMKDGHLSIIKAFDDVGYAPIGTWWFGDDLMVINAGKSEYAGLLHKKITSIGGLPPLRLEGLVNECISADDSHLLFKRLFSPDLMLSEPFLSHFNLLDQTGCVAVSFTDGAREETLSLRPNCGKPDSCAAVYRACRNEVTRLDEGNRYEMLPDRPVIYLQLNVMHSHGYEEYFRDFFKEANARKAKYLILDIRNNQGGSYEWCYEFLRYVVDRERDVFLYNGWRANDRYGNERVEDGRHRVRPAEPGLRFQGRVFLLTSAKTFSAATFFPVALKDNSLGLVVGEPVGNMSVRYGYMVPPIELANTRWVFSTTSCIWERASPEAGARKDSYILPDEAVKITMDDYINRRDPAFERVMELIGD